MNIENIQAAVAYLSTIPAQDWNLDAYYNRPSCKGCALGHLAIGRQFGLKMGISFPELEVRDGQYIGQHIGMDAANLIFGIENSDAVYLFGLRTEYEKSLHMPSDKAIWFRRVERYLASQGMDPDLMYGPEQTEPSGPSDEKDTEHPHVSARYEFA